MQSQIIKGIDLNTGGDPDVSIADSKSSSASSLLGCDYPGIKLQPLVDEGSIVETGQAVLCDRRRPQILFTSPVSGVVSTIRRGPRRSLVSMLIRNEGTQDATSFDISAALDRNSIRELMLKAGLWPALRARPFDTIPDPDGNPEALLITAIDTHPFAPNPAVAISKYNREFSIGTKLLCDLVDSPVYLCKSASQEFEHDNLNRVKVVEFDGPHPAGLVGTHIHNLCPVGFDGNQIWHIGYQDVISLGHLISTGKPWYKRVIALAGPAVNNPRLITVSLGANLADIVEQELADKPSHTVSGSVYAGLHAAVYESVLGRYHNQITAIFDSTAEAPKSLLNRLFDTSAGSAAPLIPVPDLDSAAPPGILAAPFLRALLVGDVEQARDLGALELVEEDLALLSYVCPSKVDYGLLLRNMLNQIDREGLSIRN